MKRRILSMFLALVLLISVLPVAVPVSAAYENTHSNTGNQRYDIIQVALTQVGYHEGSNNYTKYGEYFGWPNTAWCGWFVSWCAAQAGVPTSVLRRQGYADVGSFGLQKFTADEKLPQSGDLYFTYGHVGFVYSVNGNYFTTIEGNSSDQVEMETFSLYDSRYWFASPNYGGSNNASHTHTMETGYDAAHPHKEYKYCTNCDYVTYTGNQKTVADCTDCIQENCAHTYSDWTSSGDSSHAKKCTVCGKEISDEHNWKDVALIKEATCAVTGSKSQECSVCGATRTKSISKTTDHSYGEWEFSSDDTHSRTCSVCKKTVTQNHKIETMEDSNGDEKEVWQTDEDKHWQECTVCEKTIHEESHAFGEDCIKPCTVCEYVRPDGHPFSEEWQSDEENHWRACTECDELSTLEAHTYSAPCDEDCDVCGYTREVEHTFPETMESDGTSHWYECDVCGKVEGKADHLPGAEATEENAQYCTACNYELVAKIEHVHDFSPIHSDTESHWGTCRCGEELGPEVHAWDLSSGLCSVCGAVSVAETESQNWEFVWYIIGGAVVFTTVLTTVLMIVHGRKKRRAAEI